MRAIALFFVLFSLGNSLKFLVYSSRFAKSHVNFLARLSDVLVDAGHEVVIVSPIMNTLIGGPMTEKARVIEIPQHFENAKKYEDFANTDMSENVWISSNPLKMFMQQLGFIDTWGESCESVLTHPGLIDQMKKEKFDAGFGESYDKCGFALFHLIGVSKWAVTDSVALGDGAFSVTQTPTNLAYVPSLMAGESEAMGFLSRFSNAFGAMATEMMMGAVTSSIDRGVKRTGFHVPDLEKLMTTNSLVFYNSEPLVDFPKITSARTIDIGGITVSSAHEPLNKTWLDILNLRSKTILISFGTVAKSFNMPDEYKKTILATIGKFPDVTFIWKYEKPEHGVSDGLPNLIESTWVPQRDMLHDPRLSAFITHCGQGSTTESIDAGIPLIVIPVMADQLRNAHQIERNGNGIRLEKADLAAGDKLEQAIREMLQNDKYRQKAKSLKQMIADRPFAMKEIFIRNMEFLAKYGPLRQLDHYGRHLNFFQYYLLDIIAFVFSIVAVVLFVMAFTVRFIIRLVFARKSKQD